MDVTALEECGRDTVDLVAEDDAHREARVPVEEIDGVEARFDGRDLEAARARGASMAAAGSAVFDQETLRSAPSAVFAIRGSSGVGVMPASTIDSTRTASAVRKNAPTLYRLRTLSSSTVTGSRSIRA